MFRIAWQNSMAAARRFRNGWALSAALAAGIVALPAGGDPQSASPPGQSDPWAALRLLQGTWHGEVTGRLGRGTALRRYEFLFDDRYLVARHSSIRLPQQPTPEGDDHRELAVYSYDRDRETVVLREFNVEGYVLQYTCKVQQLDLVCTSEGVENGAGMRARLTVRIEDRYRFEEVFELASSGEEPGYLLTVRWTRVPDLSD